MKVIAKISSTQVIVQCMLQELVRITGKEGYVGDDEAAKLFCVDTTIGIHDSFNSFKECVNAPDRLQKLANSLRDEAARIEAMANRYERILTPPVKALKQSA